MKEQQILNALQEQRQVKTIGCIFCNTQYATGKARIYTYKTWLDHKVDDYVVVETVKGFQVVQVKEVHTASQIDGTSSIEYKWIVAALDQDVYNIKTTTDVNNLAAIKDDLRKQASAKITDQLSDDLRKRL